MLPTVARLLRPLLEQIISICCTLKIKKGGRDFYLIFYECFLLNEKPCGGALLFATAGTRMAICKTAEEYNHKMLVNTS